MMKRNTWLYTLLVAMLVIVLAACGGNNNGNNNNDGGNNNGNDNAATSDEPVELKVAALKSAYGDEAWKKIVEEYENQNENVSIELTIEKNLEEVVRPQMQAGDYPDVVLLATDREEALTETLIKERGLENISDLSDMTVSSEEATVDEKMLDGFMDTLATNPYGDGETYLAPMFYSPTGLFYNKALLEEHGWDVPETWDDMFELGEKAEEEGIALFTYPVAGYFDTMVGSMLYASGGPEFFESVMTYEEGIWETEEAKRVLETIGQLADYTHPNTVANANPNDFTKNQQLVLDNEAIFMPNGSWVVEEMAEAPRADGFEWGMAAIPPFDEDGDEYAFTFFEQIWIPEEAENKDVAKDFISFMYSDFAAETFLESGAVQPIEGIVDSLDEEMAIFYSVYDEGALPAMGSFAATAPVPGASISEELYEQIDSVVSGKTSVEEWQQSIIEVSDKLRDAME